MDEGPQAKKARGRPALPPEKGKRHAVGIRTTREVKDLLQRAADLSGRSLAQEIEYRLEASFQTEDAFGGPRTAALLRSLGAAARLWKGGAADAWLDDPRARRSIFQTWKQQLDVTHARLSEKEQSVPEVLLSEVRLFAQSNMSEAKQLAILQYKGVWASYSEEDRQNYCRVIEEITGQSQADLEDAL
jgi:hypothetical protein